MTLPSSGTISFADLQTEFGGSHPITMQEYNGYTGIGAGVQVSLSNFYGLYRRPLFQSRLSTATDGTAYCRVDNGYVSTTVANTNTNNTAVSVSLNVSAGDEVIVTVYAYNSWAADGGFDLPGMWAKANYSSNITVTGTAWSGLGADPGAGSLVTTSYSNSGVYIPYSVSNPVQIYKVDDLDNGEWYQWGFRFTVLAGHIQSSTYTLHVFSYLGQFVNKQFLITFT